jgi:flagellar hook assembly protein FlgD
MTTSVSGLNAPNVFAYNFPNPFETTTTFRYNVREQSRVGIYVYNMSGSLIQTVVEDQVGAGEYETTWNATNLPKGTYVAKVTSGSTVLQSIKLVKIK